MPRTSTVLQCVPRTGTARTPLLCAETSTVQYVPHVPQYIRGTLNSDCCFCNNFLEDCSRNCEISKYYTSHLYYLRYKFSYLVWISSHKQFLSRLEIYYFDHAVFVLWVLIFGSLHLNWNAVRSFLMLVNFCNEFCTFTSLLIKFSLAGLTEQIVKCLKTLNVLSLIDRVTSSLVSDFL